MKEQQRSLFDFDAPWAIDDSSDHLLARIVFAELPFGPYEYRVPNRLRGELRVGMRVQVPLGRGNRPVEGYCIALVSGDEAARIATAHQLKELRSISDESPLFDSHLLQLGEWIAQWYLAPLGQVLQTIVPGGVRSMAGTREVTLFSLSDQGIAALADPTRKLSPKQRSVLEAAAKARRPLTVPELCQLANCTAAPVQSLRKSSLLTASVERRATGDVDFGPLPDERPLPLNADQQAALDHVVSAMHSRQATTVLLHGVTGSGKTEVYLQAIQEVIRHGRQAIVLVPEISLTPQTRQRFRARFEQVAVLHSHQTPAERHWQWKRIAEGDVQVIVGARSAVFAPAPRLGLIVIDEEHDSSFKQDKIPRYHARDVAQRRSEMLKIPLILGTATPSLESWTMAQEGRAKLVALPQRVHARPLPDVILVDLRDEFRSRRTSGMVGRALHQRIRASLAEQGQIILLLNRRGFATSIQCPACGHVVLCPNCDLSLTHHRDGSKAICHYCDYEIAEPKFCPDCGFDGIRFAGYGTQKLEEEVIRKFPETPVLRMDSDTMKKHGSHEIALERFRSGEIKILLGTQMIAKGLDFPNVTLVGVINADTALHFPDFRAAERTFALVTQVAGRTGRGSRPGSVVVQTFSPEHPALQAASRHDYLQFVEQEIPVRSQLQFPPVGSLARFVVRSEHERQAEQWAESLRDLVREQIKALLDQRSERYRVIGPAPCPIAKLRNHYRYHLLVQGLDRQPLQSLISSVIERLSPSETVQWVVDIDPLDLL